MSASLPSSGSHGPDCFPYSRTALPRAPDKAKRRRPRYTSSRLNLFGVDIVAVCVMPGLVGKQEGLTAWYGTASITRPIQREGVLVLGTRTLGIFRGELYRTQARMPRFRM